MFTRIASGVLASTIVIASAQAADPKPSAPGVASNSKTLAVDAQSPKPASRPNIIYILLDDAGFSDIGSFGSEIRTPNLDRLAANGLRYNAFHTRAICSPSRAALLTGRNSHSVGMGNLTHVITATPGRQGRISHNAATIAEMLHGNGYRTLATGKWHLSPNGQPGAEEFSHWPIQRGFDQYFGFTGGMTDQFHPELVSDNTIVSPPTTADYHFTADMVDHSIGFIETSQKRDPNQPFFLYFATGAAHHPHQAPPEYIAKYEGTYAKGWDRIRQERFERQKHLGIIPANTQLPVRDAGVRPWDQLSENEQKVAARFQAVYAGFIEHTDAQIGRLLNYLERANLMDNTMIVVTSDNGASGTGGDLGTINQTLKEAGLAHASEPLDEQLARLDDLGTDRSSENYARGWAMASNTPFPHFKGSVDEGGLRTPLIVSWPEGIKERGKVRTQFVDIIDITPTALDVAGAKAPVNYRGIEQMPIEGASIARTFGDASAANPRSTQYFELQGQRAIWNDGWMAIADHKPGATLDAEKWKLYNLRVDFSATRDVSQANPQILSRLQGLWQLEAQKYKVLPVEDVNVQSAQFFSGNGPRVYHYFTPMTLPSGTAPQLTNKSFSLMAKVDRRDEATEGVLVAQGDRFGGFSLFVKGNRLYFDVNDFGKHHIVTSDIKVPTGKSTLGYNFKKTGDFQGVGTLTINEKAVGQIEIRSTPALVTTWASTDIGLDEGSPISEAYAAQKSFAFPVDQWSELYIMSQ